jgi:hypothetical protein
MQDKISGTCLYPSNLKMQSSAGIQIVKYQAFVLRHSSTPLWTYVLCPMSNTNNAVVGATPLGN